MLREFCKDLSTGIGGLKPPERVGMMSGKFGGGNIFAELINIFI